MTISDENKRARLRQLLESVDEAKAPIAMLMSNAISTSREAYGAQTALRRHRSVKAPEDRMAQLVEWSRTLDRLEAAAAASETARGQAASALGDAQHMHERSWAAFVAAARETMLEEFEARIVELSAELFDPIAALASAKALYSAETVGSGACRRLDPRSKIVVLEPNPNGLSPHPIETPLFAIPSYQTSEGSEILAAFCARLRASDAAVGDAMPARRQRRAAA